MLAALAAETAPEAKDVVVATLGASAALGGLVLVFLGIVIASYGTLPADAPKSVRDRARRRAWPILAAFLVTMASVALGVVWLDAPGGHTLYQANFFVFLVEIGAIVGLAIWNGCELRR